MKRFLVVMLVLVGCEQEPRVEHVPARVRGAELFNGTDLGSKNFNNGFSCATCHAGEGIRPGHPLGGVTTRNRFWGGQERDLFSTVNFCIRYFMKGEGLTRDSEDSKALYEYLASLSGESTVRPFSVVKNVVDIPRGDPMVGQRIYDSACKVCHGDVQTGAGRLTERASILPNVQDDYGTLFPGIAPGLVFIEKVRHGQFYGVGGSMPLYSLEVLSDDELGALLAYLGV